MKNLQSPVVILNHFFLRSFGNSSKQGDTRTVYAILSKLQWKRFTLLKTFKKRGCLYFVKTERRIKFKPLKLSVEKCQFFNQNNQQITSISLNSQFTVVLNAIICFSVQICDNLQLVLKYTFWSTPPPPF